MIECLTGIKNSVNAKIGSSMPGTHGLKRMMCPDYQNFNSPVVNDCWTEVTTSLKGIHSQGETYVQHLSGFFRAPIKGTYTFYALADDWIEVILNENEQAIKSEK